MHYTTYGPPSISEADPESLELLGPDLVYIVNLPTGWHLEGM